MQKLFHWSHSASQMIIPEKMAYETEIISSSLILIGTRKKLPENNISLFYDL